MAVDRDRSTLPLTPAEVARSTCVGHSVWLAEPRGLEEFTVSHNALNEIKAVAFTDQNIIGLFQEMLIKL